MSFSASLAPHLPYVRRFARALTGSQSSGDAYTSAALEAILEDPAAWPAELDPRTGLFQVLLKIWMSVPQREADQPRDAAAGPDRHLEAMTPLSRAAFLLHSVENLPVDRIAAVLGQTVPETLALIDKAGHEIASQISTDILIIEDEPLIAMDLEALVQELGHRVMRISRTRSEAVKAVKDGMPGLILADIRLADQSSGLDAVNEILEIQEVPVIFITAYPERLLTGERPEPTFLITKPFRTETVRAVISQALFFDHRARRGQESASIA
jgi:CheY-like chemotaxis protein